MRFFTGILVVAFIIVAALGGLAWWRYSNARIHSQTAQDPLLHGVVNTTVDSITICKHKRCMVVYGGGRAIKMYHISLGGTPVGAKHFEGDGKTPEGRYRVNVKNNKSAYHLSLGISYPSAQDRAYAAAHDKPTGGDIMIHGIPNGEEKKIALYTSADWTAGCIAVDNPSIEELFAHTAMGAIVVIVP